MSGKTVDITQFCELVWYDWIMYCLGTVDYPDKPLCLGKYWGAAIDEGPAMTTMIWMLLGPELSRTKAKRC